MGKEGRMSHNCGDDETSHASRHGRVAEGDGEHCWDIHDVGRFLKVSPDTVREWRKHGYGPPARRVGKHLRWRPDEVRSWFEALPADRAA
ncbi:helix-turn-helix transcriptional regulator [Nocardia wallacei]|uniref:helix-turn-helix transcriptional regulator n=1 Tax=Nocardia wallacei TaxID=480035 RepID=UPI003CC7F08A